MATDVLLSAQPLFRAIGPLAGSDTVVLQAEVTEREEMRDEMVVTEHPVEVIGAVSDHMYRRPAELHLRVGWSNAGNDDPDHVINVYQKLLNLKSLRKPMDVYTGKRAYSNMVIQSMVTETDVSSEYALPIDIHFRQVFLVQTQTLSVSSDPSNQASPQDTQPTTDSGTASTGDTSAPSSNTATGQAAQNDNVQAAAGSSASAEGSASVSSNSPSANSVVSTNSASPSAAGTANVPTTAGPADNAVIAGGAVVF